MAEIARYYVNKTPQSWVEMSPAAEGAWVSYADHISALADAERERDEANERCAAAVEDYNVQLAGHRLSAKQATENLIRATAAESTLSSQAALLEEARKEQEAAAQIIGQIESLFPNWASYRDLVDCIECTLHQLRKDAGHETQSR